MPKRILDGEGLWSSRKIARLQGRFKAEYANLIPLALANGVFECEPHLIWSRVYAFNRPEVDDCIVAELLSDLERVGLLFRWTDASGHPWGYWIGADKPGRLPPKSRERHEREGPKPPQEELTTFLAALETDHGQPLANQRSADGCVGTGTGSGTGFCTGSGTGKRLLSNKFDDSLLSKKDKKQEEQQQRQPPDLHELQQRVVEEVFTYYHKKFKRGVLYTLTPQRRKMALARLSETWEALKEPQAESAVTLFCWVVDRLAASDFHNGDNDRNKNYIEWELMFRSPEIFQKWVDERAPILKRKSIFDAIR